METSRFHVVTGGPGSGKSTRIEGLAARGCATMPEAGRAIIRDQVAIGGRALPWDDRALFAELMLAHEMRSYRAAGGISGAVLFDRGVPDVVGYLRLCGLPVPDHAAAAAAALRYAPTVFLAPYWPEIYAGDAERRQSAAEVEATARVMIETCEQLGYRIEVLPKISAVDRVRWVGERLALM